jgi:glutaredoxin
MLTITKISKNGCVPCQVLSNSLQEVDLEGVNFKEVNISEDPTAIEQYNLTGVPVLLFEVENVEVLRKIGVSSPEEIQLIVNEYK